MTKLQQVHADHGQSPWRCGLAAASTRSRADVYGPFADRFTVAGMIPMHTPQEATHEVRHCHDLNLKVVVFPGTV
jgi:hypothetical protein